MRRTRVLVPLVAVLGAACLPTLAGGGRHETTWSAEVPLAADGSFEVSNLLGSIELRGGGAPGRVRLEARVVAEGADESAARALAESISLAASPESGFVSRFPVKMHAEYALPRDPDRNAMARWITNLLDRERLSLEHGGRQIVISSSRKATRVAVHVRATVPHDASIRLSLGVGSVDAARFRGSLHADVRGGGFAAAQLFGSIAVRGGTASVEIASFQGDSVEVETGDGRVALSDVRPSRTTIRTVGGEVRANRLQTGDLEVVTAGGEVVIEETEARRFDVRTETGTVRFATRLKGLREGTVRTGSGNIDLRVGGTVPFGLTAEAPAGSVSAKRVPELRQVDDGGSPRFRRGEAGAEILVATESGGVSITPL